MGPCHGKKVVLSSSPWSPFILSRVVLCLFEEELLKDPDSKARCLSATGMFSEEDVFLFCGQLSMTVYSTMMMLFLFSTTTGVFFCNTFCLLEADSLHGTLMRPENSMP